MNELKKFPLETEESKSWNFFYWISWRLSLMGQGQKYISRFESIEIIVQENHKRDAAVLI